MHCFLYKEWNKLVYVMKNSNISIEANKNKPNIHSLVAGWYFDTAQVIYFFQYFQLQNNGINTLQLRNELYRPFSQY